MDCNNFYVSCERAFNPALRGKPVVILSNNDGCVIARSNEAKALGIEMGTIPKMMDVFRSHGVIMLSSNYTLYGDISERIMESLAVYAEKTEVYSIDEAFLKWERFDERKLLSTAKKIQQAIWQNFSVPVCVGIAATKTLAKMANRFAKKNDGCNGVFVACSNNVEQELLAKTKLENVWGIGRAHALFLHKHAFFTAAQFVCAPEHFIRTHLGVSGVRMQRELQGRSCIPLEENGVAKKQICMARSFADLTSDKKIIRNAMSNFAASCARKLRMQQCVATEICVSLFTNPHKTEQEQYVRSNTVRLKRATSNASELIKISIAAVEAIFVPGKLYLKCGIEVREIFSEKAVQSSLFDRPAEKKSEKMMQVIDKVNRQFGAETLRISTQVCDDAYKARAGMLTRRYTTQLKDIIRVDVGGR